MIDLLQECFPSCFLEDFSLIKEYTKKKVDKKKIKYVFTSNEFALNEFFKFYLIELLTEAQSTLLVNMAQVMVLILIK